MAIVLPGRQVGQQADKMRRQESRLIRKYFILSEEDTRLFKTQLDTESVIGQATFNIKMYYRGTLVELVDQVEANTKEGNLLRSKAYNLAVSGNYNRECGNRDRANEEMLRVNRWIEEAIVLDGEISEHSSQVMELSKQIETSEHDIRRARNILREVKYDQDRVQVHMSTAERHREELHLKYKDIRQLSLRLRDEEERYGLISMSESEAAEDLRSHPMAAESSAVRARKDLDVMLGTWVNDCVGASPGDTSVGQLCLPLDRQLR